MKTRNPRSVCRRQRRLHKQAADSNGINRRPEPDQFRPAVSIRIHTKTVLFFFEEPPVNRSALVFFELRLALSASANPSFVLVNMVKDPAIGEMDLLRL